MALAKIADLDPNHQAEIFGDDNLKGYPVYGDKGEEIGSVQDLLVDDHGYFRYVVVSTGLVSFGKKILLPVGYANIDRDRHRLQAIELSQEKVENLPEYSDEMTVDYDYEEKVRGVFRRDTANGVLATSNESNYKYENDASLYQMNEAEHQTLKLYEERLVANKSRFSTGTVSVRKRVETETAQMSVPVEKERVVIERKQPTDKEPVTPDGNAFIEGEVARVEIYEESANIEKQTFVREEVAIRKEVEHDTVNLQDTVRREELEVDTVDTNGHEITAQ